jgi:hypothetical protein
MGFVYDDFEILGAFTAPEKFQRYVEKRFQPQHRVSAPGYRVLFMV